MFRLIIDIKKKIALFLNYILICINKIFGTYFSLDSENMIILQVVCIHLYHCCMNITQKQSRELIRLLYTRSKRQEGC